MTRSNRWLFSHSVSSASNTSTWSRERTRSMLLGDLEQQPGPEGAGPGTKAAPVKGYHRRTGGSAVVLARWSPGGPARAAGRVRPAVALRSE